MSMKMVTVDSTAGFNEVNELICSKTAASAFVTSTDDPVASIMDCVVSPSGTYYMYDSIHGSNGSSPLKFMAFSHGGITRIKYIPKLLEQHVISIFPMMGKLWIAYRAAGQAHGDECNISQFSLFSGLSSVYTLKYRNVVAVGIC